MAETKPQWMKMKSSELESIVIDLHKQGLSPSKIGLVLRDKHAVPKAKLLGKRITRILKEANLKYDTDKTLIVKKVENINKHIEKNKHDYTAKRARAKNIWVINKSNQVQIS